MASGLLGAEARLRKSLDALSALGVLQMEWKGLYNSNPHTLASLPTILYYKSKSCLQERKSFQQLLVIPIVVSKKSLERPFKTFFPFEPKSFCSKSWNRN
jgi:hypothetical protein